MATLGENISIVYENEQEILNGANGGNSPQGQLVLVLPTSVEE